MSKRRKLPWEKNQSKLRRTVESRGLPRQTFLIVCEGEKTEPNYFKAFRVKSAEIVVEGTGCNTVSLVDKTNRIIGTYKRDEITFDQIWCVFDKDAFYNTFNDAIFKARSLGFQVAYSNEAFELWYLLHFIYFDSSITRQDYLRKLNEYLSDGYQKNSTTMFDLLQSRQEEAIKRASRLLNNYSRQNPNNENPSTTVHLLVEELNRYR